MGMKQTVVWDCERCPAQAHTDPGVVPEHWQGMGLSLPRLDAEDGFLDYSIISRHEISLLCGDCVSDLLDGFMYGEKILALDKPRKEKERNIVEPATFKEIVANIDGAKANQPDSEDVNEKAPVVGEAQEESDG